MTKTRDLADLGGGFIQAGTGAVQRTVESKLQDVVSVLDFIPQSEHAAIKAGTSTYDATDDIQAALTAGASKTVIFPRGTYLLVDGITITGSRTVIEGENSTLLFSIPNNTTNCITLSPTNYNPLFVRNITVSCQGSGLHGVYMSRGAPKLSSVTIEDSYDSALVCNCPGSSFQWVENMACHDLLINRAGRHAVHFNLYTNSLAFINETLFTQFEVRGIGRNFANANAIRITMTGSGNHRVSGFTILQSNLDARVSEAVAPVSHAIYVERGASGSGFVESLFVKGGGWESTSGTAPAGLRNIEIDSGLSISGSSLTGIINFQWCYGVGNGFQSSGDNYYLENNASLGRGALYPTAKTGIDGFGFKGGGYLGGFTNNPTGYHIAGVTLVASSNTDVDVPVSALNIYSTATPFVVTLFARAWRNNLNEYAYGVYLVSPGRESGTTRLDRIILNSGGLSLGSTFDPAAVTFSMPTETTFRITIPGGASVASGGRHNKCHVTVSRSFAGVPSGCTGLTL